MNSRTYIAIDNTQQIRLQQLNCDLGICQRERSERTLMIAFLPEIRVYAKTLDKLNSIKLTNHSARGIRMEYKQYKADVRRSLVTPKNLCINSQHKTRLLATAWRKTSTERR